MIRDIAEAQFPGMIASILQVDPSGKKIRQAITSRLPDYFRRAIEGTPIRDNMGSCGTAAFQKKRVVIQDIQNHPNWERVKDLTAKANLVSCWSEPVIASN